MAGIIKATNLDKISIGYIDSFLKNVLNHIDDEAHSFDQRSYDFQNLDDKKLYDFYLQRARGCQTKCPCCGRNCDAEHFKIKTAIGSDSNKHKCNRGHQYRGMNGYKIEHLDIPSFKICEEMTDEDVIKSGGSSYKWPEFKELNKSWDFDINSQNDINEWRGKCNYIWSKIGKEICSHFTMNFSEVAVSNQKSSTCPLHFIMALDASGSMNGQKWADLIDSTRNFLDIRAKEGSEFDIVTIIVFSENSTITASKAKIDPQLADGARGKFINGGTNFSNAISLMNSVIENSDSSTHKECIVFMSDGMAPYPSGPLDTMKRNYIHRIHKFWSIGYGAEDFSVLKQMCATMNGTFMNPHQSFDLERCYAEIARD